MFRGLMIGIDKENFFCGLIVIEWYFNDNLLVFRMVLYIKLENNIKLFKSNFYYFIKLN